METIRVAAVSMNSLLGQTQRNLEMIAHWCEQAAREKAELVVFPELVVHGHCTPNTWELAESIPDGSTVQCLLELARRHNLILSVGLSEKERDIVYNAQVLVGPQGYIGKQRKLHPSRDEVMFYKGGREIRVFDIGKCKVGTVICYDNWFPELPRIVALRGADVILMPHAAREKHWEDTPESESAARRHILEYYTSCYTMRARENACFAIYTDQAGRSGYVDTYPREHLNQPHHPGAIIFFGPDGSVLNSGQTERIRDEMVVQDLDPSLLTGTRGHPNYTLRNRRPELFAELVENQVLW
jgi:predicted amidohydrolase